MEETPRNRTEDTGLVLLYKELQETLSEQKRSIPRGLKKILPPRRRGSPGELVRVPRDPRQLPLPTSDLTELQLPMADGAAASILAHQRDLLNRLKAGG